MVGPIPVGVNRFQFTADPPQAESIPPNDILGVTVILLTCSYDDKEFIRVGYYQNNEYPEGTEERTSYEAKLEKQEKITHVDTTKVVRNILADKPKVTRFNIKWCSAPLGLTTDGRDNPDGDDIEYPPPQPLDGELDRLMETGDSNDFVASEGAVPDHDGEPESSKHPASEPVGHNDELDDIEEIGSDDDEEEDEDEEDDGEISLEEEDEELEGEDDDEMQDAEGADEDTTMQSIDNNVPAVHPVAQALEPVRIDL